MRSAAEVWICLLFLFTVLRQRMRIDFLIIVLRTLSKSFYLLHLRSELLLQAVFFYFSLSFYLFETYLTNCPLFIQIAQDYSFYFGEYFIIEVNLFFITISIEILFNGFKPPNIFIELKPVLKLVDTFKYRKP